METNNATQAPANDTSPTYAQEVERMCKVMSHKHAERVIAAWERRTGQRLAR